MSWTLVGLALFAFAIVCEQAHLVSPIVLAWSHPGLRGIAWARPIETMVVPTAAVVGALLAPFLLVSWVYWVWNVYHFGAQHYGVSRILGWYVPKWLCLGGTAALMVIPALFFPQVQWLYWVMLFALSFNHWIVDIVLSSRVSRCWWLFLAGVGALGLFGFAFKVPRVDHMASLAIPWVVRARWGAGIVHFLYSRWVWKLSDPAVRAAIA